jgi:carbamate kinase
MSLVVVALGGNALLRRGEPLDAEVTSIVTDSRRVVASPEPRLGGNGIPVVPDGAGLGTIVRRRDG